MEAGMSPTGTFAHKTVVALIVRKEIYCIGKHLMWFGVGRCVSLPLSSVRAVRLVVPIVPPRRALPVTPGTVIRLSAVRRTRRPIGIGRRRG